MPYYPAKIFAISSVLLLASCASVEQAINQQVADGFQAIADYSKGYRVEHIAIPAGAKIICKGEEKGVAPFADYYKLTEDQKISSVMLVDQCEAVWPSGARTSILAEIPLDSFPRFVHVVTERPDVEGYETDEEAGKQLLATRQKQLEDLKRALRGLLSFSISVHQMSKTNNSANASLMPAPNFRSVRTQGGITWNWIQSPSPGIASTQPSIPILPGRHSSLTPVYSATSCVGVIVMGRCSGAIQSAEPTRYCTGAFVNGRCLGAVIF